MKYISLLESFGSLLVTLLVTLLLLQKVFIKDFLEVSVLSVSNHWELSPVQFYISLMVDSRKN